MPSISKYKFWIGGALCLVMIGLIYGAMRPKGSAAAPRYTVSKRAARDAKAARRAWWRVRMSLDLI
jgi:hypothetical protein